MKKQFGFAGMLVMVLALGVLFTGCENGVQEVEGNVGIVYSKTNAVSGVTAAKTTSGNSFIVKWDAVDNAGQYEVFRQQEGKKSVVSVGSGQNGSEYAVDGSGSANSDVDKWSILIYAGSGYTSGKKYRFGVQVTPLSSGGNLLPSDIVWSDYVTR